jgi:hypothetical protein
MERVPLPSVADLIVRGGVEVGTISAETGAAISATAAAASKVAVPVAAVTSGLLGGLLGAWFTSPYSTFQDRVWTCCQPRSRRSRVLWLMATRYRSRQD